MVQWYFIVAILCTVELLFAILCYSSPKLLKMERLNFAIKARSGCGIGVGY